MPLEPFIQVCQSPHIKPRPTAGAVHPWRWRVALKHVADALLEELLGIFEAQVEDIARVHGNVSERRSSLGDPNGHVQHHARLAKFWAGNQDGDTGMQNARDHLDYFWIVRCHQLGE